MRGILQRVPHGGQILSSNDHAGKIATGYYKTVVVQNGDQLVKEQVPIYFRFSVSAVKTFLRCRRLFGYTYLMRIESPSSAAATRGKAIHAVVEEHYAGTPEMDKKTFENYVNHYELYRQLFEIAHNQRFYPRKEEYTISVEYEYSLPIIQAPDGSWVDLHGFVDLTYMMHDGMLVIIDTKTKARLDKYMLNDVTIADDFQMNAYGYVIGTILMLADSDNIQLKHVYLITDTPEHTREHYCIKTFAETKAYMQEKYPIFVEMLAAIAVGDVEKLPVGHKSACYMYNGCHMLDRCTKVNNDPSE